MTLLRNAIWKPASDVRASDFVATLPFEYRTSGNYVTKLQAAIAEHSRTQVWPPLSDISGLGWSCIRTVVTTYRNNATEMAILPGGVAVTKYHPVRSSSSAAVTTCPSAWVPAAMIPGAKLERRENFMTYGFLLNDPAACLVSPLYDLGSLRICHHFSGGPPKFIGFSKLEKGETLAELEHCLKHSLALTQSNTWADFGKGSLHDMPSNVHLETFDKGGESYFFCPHFWQSSGAGSVHVSDLLEGWALRDDLPFVQHQYWRENNIGIAPLDSESSLDIVENTLRGSDGVLRSRDTVHNFEPGIRVPYSLDVLPSFEYAFMQQVISNDLQDKASSFIIEHDERYCAMGLLATASVLPVAGRTSELEGWLKQPFTVVPLVVLTPFDSCDNQLYAHTIPLVPHTRFLKVQTRSRTKFLFHSISLIAMVW